MERNEAIEVVKRNYPHVTESGSQFETALRILIPELKENENEKIKKEIINYFKCQSREELSRKDIHNKWLAWLEKQGEQKPIDEEMKILLQTEYEKGKADAIEQRSSWSEEDEKMLKWLCRIVHSQRVAKVITLKEESELGEWMDKWLNHNPQPHWKPSDEQMVVLELASKYERVFTSKQIDVLISLKELLKKLREE